MRTGIQRIIVRTIIRTAIIITLAKTIFKMAHFYFILKRMEMLQRLLPSIYPQLGQHRRKSIPVWKLSVAEVMSLDQLETILVVALAQAVVYQFQGIFLAQQVQALLAPHICSQVQVPSVLP